MHTNRPGLAVGAALLAVSLLACSAGESPDPTQPPTAASPDDTTPADSTPSAPEASEDPTVRDEEPGTAPAPSSSPTSPAPEPPRAATRSPGVELAFVPGATAPDLALGASRLFWAAAPLVVVARGGDDAALETAEAAGVPLLLTGRADDDAPPPEALEALRAELGRLGARTVVSFDPGFEGIDGVEALAAPEVLVDGVLPDDVLGDGATPTPLEGVALVTEARARARVAAHNARAAGVEVFQVRGGDPRASAGLVEAHASGGFTSVTALGDEFGDGAALADRMRSVRTGTSLPGGGQLVFEGKRYVAMYGSPLTAALGVLGEQGVKQSVKRARNLAGKYDDLVPEEVVPMFEIIVTVASAGPGKDGNYSNELDPESIRPYVERARKAGIYVLLDLQPGRTDFLTQAKLYEEFLLEPHVGLALDPEWRLKKNQVHLRQIGSVGVKEVNRVGDYLAGLVREHALPQKMFVLHQFTTSMIRNRHRLDTSHPELATVIHVDGQGALGSKYGTWANIRRDAPEGLYWGWKNFYDEDIPMATPKQTVAVDPTPDLVTYQ